MVRKAKLVTRWDSRLKTDFSRECRKWRLGGWGVIRTRGKTEDGQRRKDGPTPWPLWRCEEKQVRWQSGRRQWVETARRQKTSVRSWDYTPKAVGSVPASLWQGWIFKTLETICKQLHSSYSNFKTVGHSPCCVCTEEVYTCVCIRCLPQSLAALLWTSLGGQQASCLPLPRAWIIAFCSHAQLSRVRAKVLDSNPHTMKQAFVLWATYLPSRFPCPFEASLPWFNTLPKKVSI